MSSNPPANVRSNHAVDHLHGIVQEGDGNLVLFLETRVNATGRELGKRASATRRTRKGDRRIRQWHSS